MPGQARSGVDPHRFLPAPRSYICVCHNLPYARSTARKEYFPNARRARRLAALEINGMYAIPPGCQQCHFYFMVANDPLPTRLILQWRFQPQKQSVPKLQWCRNFKWSNQHQDWREFNHRQRWYFHHITLIVTSETDVTTIGGSP
jgi:hypothetical protein